MPAIFRKLINCAISRNGNITRARNNVPLVGSLMFKHSRALGCGTLGTLRRTSKAVSTEPYKWNRQFQRQAHLINKHAASVVDGEVEPKKFDFSTDYHDRGVYPQGPMRKQMNVLFARRAMSNYVNDDEGKIAAAKWSELMQRTTTRVTFSRPTVMMDSYGVNTTRACAKVGIPRKMIVPVTHSVVEHAVMCESGFNPVLSKIEHVMRLDPRNIILDTMSGCKKAAQLTIKCLKKIPGNIVSFGINYQSSSKNGKQLRSSPQMHPGEFMREVAKKANLIGWVVVKKARLTTYRSNRPSKTMFSCVWMTFKRK